MCLKCKGSSGGAHSSVNSACLVSHNQLHLDQALVFPRRTVAAKDFNMSGPHLGLSVGHELF